MALLLDRIGEACQPENSGSNRAKRDAICGLSSLIPCQMTARPLLAVGMRAHQANLVGITQIHFSTHLGPFATRAVPTLVERAHHAASDATAEHTAAIEQAGSPRVRARLWFSVTG